MPKPKPYYYIRYTWRNQDVEEIAKELTEHFTLVRFYRVQETEFDMSFYKDKRDEIEVKADTLFALLSARRAILFQKESAPFTKRDMELRKTILDFYSRTRITPFPWGVSSEPKFETRES